MDDQQRKLMAELLRRGNPRPDVAVIYLVKAIVALHNVVDALAREIEGKPSASPLGQTPHKHEAALMEVREQLSAALDAATGTKNG